MDRRLALGGLICALGSLAACGGEDDKDVALTAPTGQRFRVATWRAPCIDAAELPQLFGPPAPDFVDETVRQVLRLSVGGIAVRLRLSNRHGSAPLHIGAATLAPCRVDARVDTRDLLPVRFA